VTGDRVESLLHRLAPQRRYLLDRAAGTGS